MEGVPMKRVHTIVRWICFCSTVSLITLMSCSPQVSQTNEKGDDFFSPYSDFSLSQSRARYYSLLARKVMEERMEFLDELATLLQEQSSALQNLEKAFLTGTGDDGQHAPYSVVSSAASKETRRQWQSKRERVFTLLQQNTKRIREFQRRINSMPHQIQSVLAPIVRVDARPIEAAPSQSYTVTYEQALQYYNAKKYEQALNAFQQLIRIGVSESLVDNCHFWSGVCYFQRGKVSKAISSFLTVIQLPSSDKHDAALFMLGQCYERLGNVKLAESTYTTLLQQHPETSLKYVAKQKLMALR